MRGGEAPSHQKPPPPLLSKERGIKGVRLLSNFWRGERFNLGVISVLVALLVVSIAFIGGCTRQSSAEEPSPPTEPVTPGYIRVYDYKLGYGFEYPEDWEMQVPQFESPYEKVEVFTKEGEPTRIVILVKSTNLKSLAEVKAFGYIDSESILKDGFVEINDREAYEVIFEQYPDGKARWVIFLTNNKEYTIQCYTTEDLYVASEEIFDHVINSFVIE